jgi:translation initiation factor IF-2
LKIRIFALAKELGLDSKDLIQHCIDAGLDVKSSPLASISPAERDLLMDHLKSAGAQANPTAAAADTKAPVREAPTREGQVREIRNLGAGPLSGQMKTRRGPRKESAQAPEQATPTPSPSETPTERKRTDEESGTRPVVAEASPPQPQAVPAGEPEAVETREPVEDQGGTAVEVALPETAEPSPEPDEEITSPGEEEQDEEQGLAGGEQSESDSRRPSPMERSDYVAPSGARGSSIREMKPQSSLRSSESRPTRREKKRAPSLPSLATTPKFKPPAAKKGDEGPVQTPDLALTGDILKKNKLADILRKNRDEARRPAEDEEGTKKKGKSSRGLGLEEAREARRKRRQRSRSDDDENVVIKTNKRHKRSTGPIERKTEATVHSPITVRSLSEAMGRPARDLITVLFKQGNMATINDRIEDDVALELAMELGVDLDIEHEQDFEDVLLARLERPDEEFGVELKPRPPIITVLGHVDHGKTTLVDRIRSSNVVEGEAGGITQHIAAYQVRHGEHALTFVDTPGHAAFGEMRARGANVTDIVVLVVAADDGVMPQTVECISHAKAAGAPIVVALNKCDLPDVNEQRILTELSQHGILPSEWGGDVEVVRVSALKGTGVEDLLETLILTAELHELKTPEEIPAEGVCLEAFRDEGRGPVVWSIVRRGTLRVGDVVLCGPAYGRVRAMYDDQNREITAAGPSTPVKIAGLHDVPGPGSHFFVMDDIERAREYAEQRAVRGRTALLAGRGGPVSLEEFFATRDGTLKDLPLIIKADTPGSIEAIKGELDKFEHEEVRIKIIHEAVGGVNESDVYLAASAGAIIIAFHVIAEDRAEALAQQEGVDVRRYNIIYNVIDEIRQALEGLLSPEKVEVQTGRALVLRTFSISRVGTVAGCRVLNGTIDRNNRVHVIRDQTIINDYPIASLKREKDDVREVREGYECGIRLDGFNDVKEGDLLEAYRIEERKRSLDE